MSTETPGEEFGRYRLIGHLATGGMAEIHLAVQTGPAGFEKPVVIKRIHDHLAREKRFITMLFDEARIAANLNHRNVVQILDLGYIDGQYFICMEYLFGENLLHVLKSCHERGVSLPYEHAAGIVMQAAEGLHHAHTRMGQDGHPLGIVHRDISHENVFVLYDGIVKLVDFGMAKAVRRSTRTRAGTIKGKLAYMSPEQAQGKEIDARSDLFSLGIVLWECLTDEMLFPQENELALMSAITQEDARSPATIDPDVPEELCHIALKALSRDRDQRYQSAEELRSALAGYLKSSQVEADSAAIGGTMRNLFSERMESKRKSPEVALATDEFARMGQPASRPGRLPWVVIGVMLLLLVMTGVAVTWLSSTGRDESLRPEDELQGAGDTVEVEAEPAPERTSGSSTNEANVEDEPEPVPVPKRRERRRVRRRKPPRVEPPPAASEEQAAGPPGLLRLMTKPWAVIYHRGRRIGQTPLVDVELPSGVVRLRAINPKAGIDAWITVRIKPGEVVTKWHSFL